MIEPTAINECKAKDDTILVLKAEIVVLHSKLKAIGTCILTAIDLDGFGCACSPVLKCGTCSARDTTMKVMLPLIKELTYE